MKDLSSGNFGLMIAFLLPGFIALWGIGQFSPTVHSWFGGSSEPSPSVGGFLYVTLGAIAAGLFVSTVRWLAIDTIHHRTGIPEPTWDFAALNRQLPTFELLIALHYRFYQAYANMVVAVLLTFAALTITSADVRVHFIRNGAVLAAIETVLWLGSRDTLRKYYRRAEALMNEEFSDEQDSLARRRSRHDVKAIAQGSHGKSGLKIEGPFR